MLRQVAGFLALLLAFVLASWVGWWVVPVTAALWGALRPAVSRPLLRAALAAALAWAFWLAVDVLWDPGALARLGTRVGGVMQLPFPLLLMITLLFPALLAWSAAALAGRLAGFLNPRTGDP